MRELNILSSKKDITLDRLVSFMDFWNIEIDKNTLFFLSKYAGTKISEKIVKTRDNRKVIEIFLCLLDNPNEDKIGCYDMAVILTQLGDRLWMNEDDEKLSLLPIASLFSGDFICLDYREGKIPTVCVWDHEESDELNPVTETISKNIEEFLEMLEE